ncbi:MAG: type IV pilus twitching motility protein PilT [Elusimicrobia bacterium]|nr:type IV pilus twitching motility protein PilT [Candidatus Obscuribacterium magneticum]
MINMSDLLLMMVQKRASDLHLTAGAPPMLRIDGHVVPTPFEKLTPEVCQRLIYSLLTDQQRQSFEAKNELDLSFGIKGIGRVRMNVFRQRMSVGAALRAIPSTFRTFEELGIPEVIYETLKLPRGLILVTGPTGSGKSTTLATMIDYLNENRDGHIITIEDPIEFLHQHKKCIINQREIGQDTGSFTTALKYVLRQDPDVILIGEMRDLETIQAAITIAETGHLVLTTLHTNDAPTTINRIIDVFPSHQQLQVRNQLSFVIQAVICQMLMPHVSGTGLVLSSEVMIATHAIKNLIREGKAEQIPMLIQTGGKHGMQTMNQSLVELTIKRKISQTEAVDNSSDIEELKKLIAQRTQSAIPK